jgi:tRNA-(guanine-N1)-methyltransferase
MQVNVVTLFPELFTVFSETSFVKKAIVTDKLALRLEPLREHGLGKHKRVDDDPYGGGAGMVLRVDASRPRSMRPTAKAPATGGSP